MANQNPAQMARDRINSIRTVGLGRMHQIFGAGMDALG